MPSISRKTTPTPAATPRPVARPQATAGAAPKTSVKAQQPTDQNQARQGVQGSASASLSLHSDSEVTRDTLMAAIRADNGPGGLAPLLSNRAKRQTFENIADTCIKVGEKQGVDPRILFAMAMQESDCGLNTRHSSSAQGVTGMKPTSAPDRSARGSLSNPEVCLTQTAKYLKGQLVRELRAKGHSVSAADMAPGVRNSGTEKIMLAYRFGAGGVNTKLRRASLQHLVTTSDYKHVFRHMKNMGL